MFSSIGNSLLKLTEKYHQWRRNALPPSVSAVDHRFDKLEEQISRLEIAFNLHTKAAAFKNARALLSGFPEVENAQPHALPLSSRATRQAEFEQPWLRYWLRELKIPAIYNRKLWEYAFVLQSIYDSGLFRPGVECLVFGGGDEPLPSYLASKGMNITVTDLEPEAARRLGWIDTMQHASTLDKVYKPQLVDKETFRERVSLRFVDMNAIDPDLRGYDICWSICAFEHLGSIKNGLEFVVNSLDTLRPGGVAIHTTEFNCLNDEDTIDNNPYLVLFQRRHFSELATQLTAAGHVVAPLSFDVGVDPLDLYVDMPPYADSPHLKILVRNYATTCFGLVIRKAGAG